MLTHEQVMEVLLRNQAILEGHFQLTSGRHAARYVQCAKLFVNPADSELLCGALAEMFRDDNVELVVGPAIGAILMSYEVARQLGVPNYFSERENGTMTLRRGFVLKPGTRVLCVEDVVTTGGSVGETVEMVRALGGVPVGVGVIADRSGGKANYGEVPLRSLIKLDIANYDPAECPLCKEGSTAYKPGSRQV